MNRTLTFAMAVFETLIGLVATGCGTVRAGYESAPYSVVRAQPGL